MMIDCTNYVITHMPYPVDQTDMYRKLCVGNYYDDINLSECEGENIAEYNDRLNELTGLYWIWKNTASDYVGLSHYRRFFRHDGKRLDRDTVEQIIVDDGYDIILSDYLRLPWPVNMNIKAIVGENRYRETFGQFLRAIVRNQPEYETAFLDVMNGSQMYHKNMFVCRREIMERYCEWLFSFLLEATDQVNVADAPFYEKRVCGYFGEVMWTVWLKKQNLKIYEMQIGVK